MKFSVITVCKNSALSISRTIQSVLDQTYADFELIIIDGCSTDGTLQRIQQFKDKRITFVSEPDLGIFNAMNKGVAFSSGEVISILNSDDFYLPNTLEQVANFFMTNRNVDILCGDVLKREGDGSTEILVADIDKLDTHMMPHPGVFMRVCDEYSVYFDERYTVASDYDLLLRIKTSGRKIARLPRAIAHYSSGGFSDSPSNRILSIFETHDIQKRHISNSFRLIIRKYRFILGTILRRDNRLDMVKSMTSCFRHWGFF